MTRLLLILPLCFLFTGCEKLFFEPEPAKDPEALFEELWNTYNEGYAPFEERNVNWDYQYSLYRQQVNSNTTEEELYTIFTQMLSSLNDGHVSLVIPNKKAFNSNTYFNRQRKDSLFNLDLIKSAYLTSEVMESGEGGNVYGKISNLGYWHMKWIGDNLLLTDEILDYMADVDGLIIDLRNNAGGDMTYSLSELGRLTETERFTHRSKTKNGPGKSDYTEWYNWSLPPKGTYFNKPIVLITDRYTISAGERTTMILKALPNVIHVGDTTNGSLSTKIGRELPNAWYYSFSPQKIEFVNGVSYEGTGLSPTVYSKNTISEILGGLDKTLQVAIDAF